MTLIVVLLVLGSVLAWPAHRRVLVASGRGDDGSADASPPSLRAWWQARRSRGGDEMGELADLAEALSMALDAGATPVRAVEITLASARPDGRWVEMLQEVRDRLALAEDAGPVLRRAAAEVPDLTFVAGAWSLSERLGTPLAPAMSAASAVLRERLSVQRRLDTASAGPRATMVMLTALPAIGLLAGLAFGRTPWEVVLHSGATITATVLGVLLTAGGWLLGRTILARALKEPAC